MAMVINIVIYFGGFWLFFYLASRHQIEGVKYLHRILMIFVAFSAGVIVLINFVYILRREMSV